MKEKAIIKFVEFILKVSEKSAMFNINRVEDINLICLGYIHALEKNELESVNNFLHHFRIFVNKEFESNEDHSWERLIRLYSASDAHSIKLFCVTFEKYINYFEEVNDYDN